MHTPLLNTLPEVLNQRSEASKGNKVGQIRSGTAHSDR